MADLRLPTGEFPGPVIAHCDASKTRALVPRMEDRAGFLLSHIGNIDSIVHERSVWFPAFNYDFLGSRTFDTATDPSQVGAITEFARQNIATWRSAVPVFTLAGTGAEPIDSPNEGAVIEPFDSESVFGRCVKQDGVVMWYGAPFSTATILHTAEALATGPLYRFDKDFAGTVTSDGEPVTVTLRYHVRPMDRHLDYDWARIIPLAQDAGIIRQLGDSPVFWASAAGLVEHWVTAQRKDPLYLLDAESRMWVEPMLSKLGRRFERADFEQAS